MARVSDFIYSVKQVGPIGLARRVWKETSQDNIFTNAAAMAYAWMFAVFPFLIFVLTLLPYLPERMRHGTHAFIERFLYQSGMTWQVVHVVLDNVDNVMQHSHGGLLSFGLLLTLYAASGGMNMTMSALDEAFEVKKPRSWIKKRLWAIALMLFMTFGMFVILIALPVSALVIKYALDHFHELPAGVLKFINAPVLIGVNVARYLVGLIAMQLMIGVLYRFGPSEAHRLRLLSPGAIFATLGWIATGAAIRVYFTNFSDYSKTYGAVAGLVIMLMVFYLDGIIVLIGAELDSEVERCIHKPDGTVDCVRDEHAETVPTAQQIANPT